MPTIRDYEQMEQSAWDDYCWAVQQQRWDIAEGLHQIYLRARAENALVRAQRNLDNVKEKYCQVQERAG